MSTPSAVSPCLLRTGIPPIPEVRTWAAAYRGEAGALIDLTQAVPGYPPHRDLLSRLSAAAATEEAAAYGDITGDAPLRAALAAEMTRLYAAPIAEDTLAITAGCNLAFVMAAMVAAGPGDAVLLPCPWYFNHAMALDMRGVEPRPLPCRAEDGFVPDPDLAATLIDDRVRAIVLISPNNPTGAIYPPETIARFYELCRKRGIWLILDETYRDFLPDAGAPHTLFSDPDWGETLVELYSFSKAYCVPGHRVGAIAAGARFRGELAKVLDTLQICPSRTPQMALAWAVEALRDWREGNRAIMTERARVFRAAMQAAPAWRIDALGGYFGYLRLPDDAAGAEATARHLATDRGLLVLPGPFFGPGQERHLRVAFANVETAAIGAIPGRLETSR